MKHLKLLFIGFAIGALSFAIASWVGLLPHIMKNELVVKHFCGK